MMLPASIAALATQAAALEQRLLAFCAINSGSDHPAGLARMADALVASLRTLTADVVTVPLAGGTTHAIRARRRPQAPVQILLNGHYDTVYGATHPFQTCTRADATTLRGPGVVDMKGGLVVLLAALEAFEHSGDVARVGWEVLLTPDEETGSHASRAEIEAAARRHHLGLVFEPARENGDIIHSRKGTGTVSVVSHGRAAHAAVARQSGRNAIAALSEFLVGAHRLPDELPGVLLNIGLVHGGGEAINIVPARATAELDVRITRAGDEAALRRALDALAAPLRAREGHALDLELHFNRPPFEASPVTTALFGQLQTAARDLGLAPFSWLHAGGGSDANLLAAAGLPCLDGLGPIGGELHSDREWIHLPSLVERSQLAALFLHRLATGEIRLPA